MKKKLHTAFIWIVFFLLIASIGYSLSLLIHWLAGMIGTLLIILICLLKTRKHFE